ARFAWARAPSASTCLKALRMGLNFSIRARKWLVTSTGEISFAPIISRRRQAGSQVRSLARVAATAPPAKPAAGAAPAAAPPRISRRFGLAGAPRGAWFSILLPKVSPPDFFGFAAAAAPGGDATADVSSNCSLKDVAPSTVQARRRRIPQLACHA